METLQLKVLRNILSLNTTYIDRENNNHSIFEKTNQAIEEENIGKKKKKNMQLFLQTHTTLQHVVMSMKL